MEHLELNVDFKKAIKFLENSNKNLFITGRAGTGKSTLLHYFCENTKKKVAVLAPTGVAALNVSGQTIHSFFGFKPNVTLNSISKVLFNDDSKNLYKIINTIIIDEISMVRVDLLDCIDKFLRLNRDRTNVPFGGVQMVFIGDLYQLPPVITYREKSIISKIYKTPYFYSAKVFENLQMEFIELTKVYRQKDSAFIELLTRVRNNSISDSDLALLNTRVIEYGADRLDDSMGIYLTTTNKLAAAINSERLGAISEKLYTFDGTIEGEFGEENFPTLINLKLKVGAQVMLINNDIYGRWVNGTIGNVLDFKKDDDGNDFIVVQLKDTTIVDIYPYKWNIYRYSVENGKLNSEVLGSFIQYPLMLAWAITIHKSQGKTFDNVVLDIGDGAFSCGQIYVALSRCKSLEGIILKRAILRKHIWSDFRVVDFITKYQYRKSEEKMSNSQKIDIIRRAIDNNFLLEIIYLKTNDTKTKRLIKPLKIDEMEYCGKSFKGFQAFCMLRNENRIFRIERILEIKEVKESEIY